MKNLYNDRPRFRRSTVANTLLLPLLLASAGLSADFFVNSNGDQGDALPGNGFCSTSTMFSICTLRAAVEEANALPGVDTVFVGSRTVVLGTPLNILDPLFLLGNGPDQTVLHTSSSNRVLEVESELQLWDVAIEGVRTGLSGAVSNTGFLVVKRSLFVDNEALSCGAIATIGGDTQIHASSFLNNRATQEGGAVCVSQDGSLQALNATFAGNEARRGAVLHMTFQSSSSYFSMSTFAFNLDTEPADGPASSVFYVGFGTLEVNQSLILGSCDLPGATMLTSGWNMEGPGDSCLPATGDNQSNLSEVELALGMPGDFGGPVPTVLPGTSSVAVDPPSNWALCLPTDARGQNRIGTCDVGAVERQPGDPETGPVFVDGFESGDTSSWSSAEP